LLIGYAWLYAAFALVLTVTTPFDATHVGDLLNVAVALGATLGVYAYLRRAPALPTSVWRGLLALIVVYDLVTILLVLSTGNDARGFHWLLGSTAPGSKAYDVIAIAVSLPGLATLWRLGRRAVVTA
jgi:hypothetical protein